MSVPVRNQFWFCWVTEVFQWSETRTGEFFQVFIIKAEVSTLTVNNKHSSKKIKNMKKTTVSMETLGGWVIVTVGAGLLYPQVTKTNTGPPLSHAPSHTHTCTLRWSVFQRRWS